MVWCRCCLAITSEPPSIILAGRDGVAVVATAVVDVVVVDKVVIRVVFDAPIAASVEEEEEDLPPTSPPLWTPSKAFWEVTTADEEVEKVDAVEGTVGAVDEKAQAN